MKVSYSWLKDYVGDTLPPPETVEALLTFHSFEVDGVETVHGDTVFDISVLPNRASDCLSHRGIARELASLLNVSLTHDPLTIPPILKPSDAITITIKDTHACPRFTAAWISGVTVGDSPAWLQKRLSAIGQRSINNIVDATNYVMYSIGQPLHAYDADLFTKQSGTWHFLVRKARPGETVSLLAEGGKNEDRIVTLIGSELLIVDGSTDTPIGLAGVKGGRYAGVHAGTKNIIIEAAHFDPVITRMTARRLGIIIDASKRFENEPSRDLLPYAQADIIGLVTDIAGGTFEGFVDEYSEHTKPPEVAVSIAHANSLLGLSVSSSEMVALLNRIGARVISQTTDTLTVVGPWERTDLTIAEDFIEEIGRVCGLSNIVSVPPPPLPVSEINVRQFYTEAIRKQLIEHGFSEVITSSFAKSDAIQLHNALASDKSFVRSTLVKNITLVLDQNFAHIDLLGIPDVRVFEIGTVFTRGQAGVTEHVAIALGVRSKGNGYSPRDDEVLTDACRVVETVLGVPLAWTRSPGLVEAHLDTLLQAVPVPQQYQAFDTQPPAQYRPVSMYPAVTRDIALWVSEGEMVDAVLGTIQFAAGDLCVRAALFDTFTKDNRTSFAFRLVFQSFERTLTDVEVNTEMERVYAAVRERGWEVR